MTDAEYDRKLDELDHLLNDPNVPMQPAKVWSLLAEISGQDVAVSMAEASASRGMAQPGAAWNGIRS